MLVHIIMLMYLLVHIIMVMYLLVHIITVSVPARAYYYRECTFRCILLA